MDDRGYGSSPPIGADLYGELLLSENAAQIAGRFQVRDYIPGLIVVTIASIAATWLSEHYAMPVILAGLLIGLALNFVSTNRGVHMGLDLCSTKFLRWGIVLLGTQVTFAQIHSLGIVSFLALVTLMILVIIAGLVGARMSGQDQYVGWIAGGATAICGASAALAIYAIIGRERLDQHRFTFTLVAISMASAIAMSFYPILASYYGFSDRQAGFLTGAAIHDVAQALGGGYSYSSGAGEVATIVKLSRVALLAPAIAMIGLFIGPQNGQSTSWAAKFKPPWFIIMFFLLLTLNSFFHLPQWLNQYGLIVSKGLLLGAVVATAMGSRLEALLSDGWRGLLPVAMASLISFIAAFWFAWMVL